MSTDWYAPNQQAVRADGSGPAEEGGGGDTFPKPEPVGEADDRSAQDAEAEEPEQFVPDLDSMTKAELLDYASGLGVEVDPAATKADIRAVIEQAERR